MYQKKDCLPDFELPFKFTIPVGQIIQSLQMHCSLQIKYKISKMYKIKQIYFMQIEFSNLNNM